MSFEFEVMVPKSPSKLIMLVCCWTIVYPIPLKLRVRGGIFHDEGGVCLFEEDLIDLSSFGNI